MDNSANPVGQVGNLSYFLFFDILAQPHIIHVAHHHASIPYFMEQRLWQKSK